MLDFLKDHILKIVIIFVVIVLGVIVSVVGIKHKQNKDVVIDEVSVFEPEKEDIIVEEEIAIPVKMLNVDVKGLVNNPGVYQVEEGTIINRVLELAGGLKKGATTKNINLSKKVSDEMVIYVYSEAQLNKMNESNNIKECSTPEVDIRSCSGSSVITSDNSNNDNQVSGKISINRGTKEQLMTLSGIGESKALAIIDYREKNNGFKTLEEIMNVSGIGEAAYSKIKDFIEL